MADFAPRIPYESLRGLRPRAWICVGPGFVREEVKSEALKRGISFVGDAITTLEDLSARLLSVAAESVLASSSRQEVLRMLLSEARINDRLPELKRLRRQGSFFRRLDQAIQAGRMASAHAEEDAVYCERLEQKLGPKAVREDVRALARAYETWLEASGLYDPPRLQREATARLREGWPEGLAPPVQICFLTAQVSESLERDLLEELARHCAIERLGPLGGGAEEDGPHEDAGVDEKRPSLSWQLWHTLDDAAEELAEEIARLPDVSGDVVLIPDSPDVRRSLIRALAARGIPLADLRDPTRVRWDEGVKWAMLPLEVVGRGFERRKVAAWLRAFHFPKASGEELLEDWVRATEELANRGIRQGLEAYSGGRLEHVHARLSELEARLGGRRLCEELAQAHLELLREVIGADPARSWIPSFFEALWKGFARDASRTGLGARKAPLRFWLERFQRRVAEAPPPVEKLKAEGGLGIYRLQQAPLRELKRLWILGMPPNWLSGEGSLGDYWFTEREREVLSGEFAVRSAFQVREERLAVLRSWISMAGHVRFMDALYSPAGQERESLAPILREIGGEAAPEAEDKGAHPRWMPSMGSLRPVPPQDVRLAPRELPREDGEPPVITATALDLYSRCGFQALALNRWKLRDAREPDTELWHDARGNLLHEALRILMASREGGGASSFGVSPAEALERAWRQAPPRGLLRGARVERYVKSRLLAVLNAFCEKEREYAERSGARVANLEEVELRLEIQGPDRFTVIGRPDRIDEYGGGLFIIDYKTGSDLPTGTQMLELGYKLQLPFYAVAARKQLGKPVLGLQFVALTRAASRSNGLFFKRFNGKENGRLTAAGGTSKSLLDREPDEVWSALESRIAEQGRGLIEGRFGASPKRGLKECEYCRVSDLCGHRRALPSDTEGGGE